MVWGIKYANTMARPSIVVLVVSWECRVFRLLHTVSDVPDIGLILFLFLDLLEADNQLCAK